MDASFAASFPLTIGGKPSWIEACVLLGSTHNLVPCRWLSRRRCRVKFDPSSLTLQSPDFCVVPLKKHSFEHVLLSDEISGRPCDYVVVVRTHVLKMSVADADDEYTDSEKAR